MKKLLKSMLDRAFGPLARKSDIENLYAQISSLLEIKDLLGPGIVLGPLRGWALSPDALAIVLRDLMARNAPNVVEFGCGESTLAIAAALKRLGGGSLLSIEHEAGFAETTRARLGAGGLLGQARIEVLPIREYAARPGLPCFRSYDLDCLETAAFDVALVDGPITPVFGAATRAVPLDWCIARLRNGSAIYLDDAARPEEQAVVAAARRCWPEVEVELIPTEKGLCRFTGRGGQQANADQVTARE